MQEAGVSSAVGAGKLIMPPRAAARGYEALDIVTCAACRRVFLVRRGKEDGKCVCGTEEKSAAKIQPCDYPW